MKTVFVTVGSGLVARNIVTSGVLKKLIEQTGCRVVALVQDVGRAKIPENILHDLESSHMCIEIVSNYRTTPLENLFQKVVTYLPFTSSTKISLMYHATEKKRLSLVGYWLYWIFYTPLSKITSLKHALRVIDSRLFKTDQYDSIFEKYKPDLVFATSLIYAKFDLPILREAKRRNIKTVAMTKSWDNLDKTFFRIQPDIFLVQGEPMRDAVVRCQAFPAEIVRIVGFPQFDMYRDTSLIESKESYARKKGFDPTLPVIFLGSEGMWTCLNDGKIFKKIIEARDSGHLPPCNILIRPHFSAIGHYDYTDLGREKLVFIDDTFHHEPFFMDNWNLTFDDMVDFMNSLYHTDAMVMFASTLTLDAACFDKPIIGVGYGTMFRNGKDVSPIRFQTTHFQWVMEEDPVDIVYSESELISTLNAVLANPNAKSHNRKKLLTKLCRGADGKSSTYIVEEIAKLLNEAQL